MVAAGWAVRTSDKPKRYQCAQPPEATTTATPAPVTGSGTASDYAREQVAAST